MDEDIIFDIKINLGSIYLWMYIYKKQTDKIYHI